MKKTKISILLFVFIAACLIFAVVLKGSFSFFSPSSLDISIQSYLEQDLKSLDPKKIKKMAQIKQECFGLLNKRNLRSYLLEKYSNQPGEIRNSLVNKKVEEWSIRQKNDSGQNILSQKGWVLAFSSEDLVGMYHCTRDWGFTNGDKMIYSLCVDKKYRGRGIGKKLIENALDICREDKNDLNLLVEKFNSRAIKLYEKMGFKIIEPEKTPADEMELYGRYFMRFLAK